MGRSGSDGASSTVMWKGRAGGTKSARVRAFRVRAAPLDDVLLVPKPVSVLKLDIEGSEWRALLGAQRIVAAAQVVILEVFPVLLQKSGCLSPAMLALTLPGFTYAHEIRSRFRKRHSIGLRLLPNECMALDSWERWEECTDVVNFFFTRQPLIVGLRPWQAIRM